MSPLPRRKQARRDRDYKAVHRPTKWGNPFDVATHGRAEAMRRYEAWLDARLRAEPDFLEPLRGHDLGCFCPPDVACHADVILRKLYGPQEVTRPASAPTGRAPGRSRGS